jgi:mono/diheme cytochrome c family protein
MVRMVTWLGGLAASGLALLALAGLGPVAPAGADQEEIDQVLADMGSEFYQRYCASCHGIEGKGDGPAASVLDPPPKDLTRIAVRRGGKFPDGEIARYVDGRFEVAAHGSRTMPVWGESFGAAIPDAGVSEEVVRGRILVIVEYLKSIQVRD